MKMCVRLRESEWETEQKRVLFFCYSNLSCDDASFYARIEKRVLVLFLHLGLFTSTLLPLLYALCAVHVTKACLRSKRASEETLNILRTHTKQLVATRYL